MADEERLALVMAHLFNNALDAAPEQSRVEIRLSMKGREAIIEVIDDGPGMAPDFIRDELFRPFCSTKDGGFGIGAYESRECIHELGGRLEVISAPGKGSTFRIALPAIQSESHELQLQQV